MLTRFSQKWHGGILAVLMLLGAGAGLGLAQNSPGGSFLPGFNYVIGGQWTWRGASPFIFEGATDNPYETTFTVTDPTADRTWTVQNATDTFVGRATTDTLTNKTLSAATVTGGMVRASYTTQLGTRAKVGGTAGWAVAAANDLPYIATAAAGATAGTLVIPIDGLHIGDTITAIRIVAQIESGGNTATLDAALRAVTNVAAEPTDAAISGGGIVQVSVTADTAVSATVTGIAETVTSGKTYYILVTVTTGASTDVILQACEITVTQS